MNLFDRTCLLSSLSRLLLGIFPVAMMFGCDPVVYHSYVYNNVEVTGQKQESSGDIVFSSILWKMPDDDPARDADIATIVIDETLLRIDTLDSSRLESLGFRPHGGLPDAYVRSIYDSGRNSRRVVVRFFSNGRIMNLYYTGSTGGLYVHQKDENPHVYFINWKGEQVALPVDEHTLVDIWGKPDSIKTNKLYRGM